MTEDVSLAEAGSLEHFLAKFILLSSRSPRSEMSIHYRERSSEHQKNSPRQNVIKWMVIKSLNAFESLKLSFYKYTGLVLGEAHT